LHVHPEALRGGPDAGGADFDGVGRPAGRLDREDREAKAAPAGTSLARRPRPHGLPAEASGAASPGGEQLPIDPSLRPRALRRAGAPSLAHGVIVFDPPPASIVVVPATVVLVVSIVSLPPSVLISSEPLSVEPFTRARLSPLCRRIATSASNV